MSMQKRLRGLVLAVMMSFVGYVAYAEVVTVSTYYPSPYCSCSTLDIPGPATIATNPADGVGIGGPAPAGCKLYLEGQEFRHKHASGFHSWYRADNTRKGRIQCDDDGDFVISQQQNFHMRFHTNNTEKMCILNNGNVGIGHPNPDRPLHINGDCHVDGNLRFGSGGNAGDFQCQRNAGDGKWYATYAP